MIAAGTIPIANILFPSYQYPEYEQPRSRCHYHDYINAKFVEIIFVAECKKQRKS